MKLTSFKINNFRSIKYLKCHVSPQITILAGKNESGKTSILLALEKFKKKFTDSDIPISGNKDDISVTGIFELTKSEIKSISEKYSLYLDSPFNEITAKATFDGIKIYGKACDKFKEKILEETEDQRETAMQQINSIQQTGYFVDLNCNEIDNLNVTAITNIKLQFSDMLNQLQSNPPSHGNYITVGDLLSIVNILQSLLQRAEMLQSMQTELKNYMPNIIYFDSFEDKLPSEIDLQEAIEESDDVNKTTVAKDLIKLSKLDPKKLNDLDIQHRTQATADATEISSELFGKYWRQDPIEIIIGYDESKLSFFVRDQGKTFLFKPSQRSRGIQWFMCFLTRLFIHDIDSKNNLILIDEPGLYLHSKAQQDVLEILEDISSNSQIIFSTHSPYLIDPNKLNRIRLVIKTDDKKTILDNNFNKNSDVDTMYPIITAIGLDLSKGIGFLKKKNIIVEGVSDYYYLLGMKIFLENHRIKKFREDLVFVPCVGESKIPFLASIFLGYGLDFKIILDSKGTHQTRKKLKNDELGDKIIVVGKDEESIEDMFTKDELDYIYGSDKECSKTIISKRFLEKIQNGQKIYFSDITISKFEKLFEKITEFKD